METKVVVLHGCCKGTRSADSVRLESTTAAIAVGADERSIRSSYYTCDLDRVVIADGHDTPMPEQCDAPRTLHVEKRHDDSRWEDAIAERLEDPTNRQNIARLLDKSVESFPDSPSASGLPALGPDNFRVLGPWVGSWFIEFHVYVSGGHQPEGRQAVWDAIGRDFSGLDGGDYVLIAHSLGSIISASLLQGKEIPQPAAYVTVGSQLGWSALSWFGLEAFHLNGNWINVIDSDDPSAGFFSGSRTPADTGYTADEYLDLWVTNSNTENPHDFVGYMRTAEAVAKVGALL